jgi:polyisoprenoid-binding protein YceI
VKLGHGWAESSTGVGVSKGESVATELETQRGMVRVPTGAWSVDLAHSSVEFRVKRMMILTSP